MDYERMYKTLSEGVKGVVREMKDDIYSERMTPAALKYMSDLKLFLMKAENPAGPYDFEVDV